MMRRQEDGFSLIEIMVALMVFSLVSFAFLSVMLSGSRSGTTTRDNVRVAEEARLGLNRMVRDTREAGWISLSGSNPNATHDSFTVKIDYNGNGTYANPAPPSAPAEGNYEVVTYAYDDAGDRITLTAEGYPAETLIKGVDCVREPPGGPCKGPIFSFTSNRLEYDLAPADGVTTLSEINAVACPPTNNTSLDACNSALVDKELANISSVGFALALKTSSRTTNYYAEAQLRNRR
ncbi:MAG: prepilin-type N-terminal cleavage/methylation domain-containing protein [Actinomycetota bacterium]|nr:prepilin-type N-terminal cleavage/methylation domain-containing protein [Actinomycetota bacterium]